MMGCMCWGADSCSGYLWLGQFAGVTLLALIICKHAGSASVVVSYG
jgi:hypothetical protein